MRQQIVIVASSLGAGAGLVLDCLERVKASLIIAAVPVSVLHLNLGLFFTFNTLYHLIVQMSIEEYFPGILLQIEVSTLRHSSS